MKMNNISSHIISLLIYILAISLVAFGLTKRAKELSTIVLVVTISLTPLAYTQAMKYKFNSNNELNSDHKPLASMSFLIYTTNQYNINYSPRFMAG